MNRPPSFCFCQASVSDIAEIQADVLRYAAEVLEANMVAGRFWPAGITILTSEADDLERSNGIAKKGNKQTNERIA